IIPWYGMTQQLILVGRGLGLASYPDLFRHSDELHKGLSLHFAHDLSAMHFDGDFTASQLTRDLLIKQARHDQPHHFALPLCQRLVTATESSHDCPFLACSPVSF